MQIEMNELITMIKQAAQAELLPRFEKVTKAYKSDGSIITEADTAAQAYLQERLQDAYPKITLLAEEMSVDQQNQALEEATDGVWILDPIDGTSNFSHGLPYYCVSLALIRDGQVQLGIVYDPERDECFSAQLGQGAFLNGVKLNAPAHTTPLNKALVGVDFKRLPGEMAAKIASNPPYASQRSLGSIALDWCWVSAGRIQAYLHGKHNLWDYAACWLILEEAGGASQTMDGETVFVAEMLPRFAMAAVSNELLDEWYQAVAK